MSRRALVVAATLLAGALAPLTAPAPAPARPAAGPTVTTSALSPELRAALSGLRAGQMTTVLVTLRDQASLSPTADPGRLVRRLQSFADREQAPLRAALADWRTTGVVGDVQPLWVTDAVRVTATAAVVRAIASRADVATVAPDAVDLVPAAATALAPAGAPTATVVADGADQVWAGGDTGEGVVVATLDTGADVTHPDLQPSWRGGTNSWYDPYGQHPTSPVDLSGHGTAALGLVVGGDASGQTIGVAPGARWIAARVFDDRGAATATAVHQAFQWVLDPDHDPATDDAPDVVSASWSFGAPGCDQTFRPDVQALVAAGILPVFAAGNFGPGAGTGASPANYPESLAVGALASDGDVLGLSSRGPDTCGGRTTVFPDLVAPGQGVETTDLYGLWQTTSGTSVSAPQVAGALALMLSAHPGLTSAEQRAALLGAAVDVGTVGPDDASGDGRVDAHAAWTSVTGPGYAVAAPPTPAAVAAGGTTDLAFTVTGESGFTGDVQVAATLPTGWSGSPSPALVAGGSGTVHLPVTVPAGQAGGDYPVTLTTTSGWRTRTATVSVPVTAPGFALTGPPSPVPLVAGTTTDLAFVVTGEPGFAGDVQVTATLPAGWSGAPTPALVTGGSGTVHLPVTAPAAQAPGSYPVTLTATSAGQTRSATVTVAVTAPPPPMLELSTLGSFAPPGLAGTADDADVLRWDGTSFTRTVDAGSAPYGLPASADVDAFERTGTTSFLVSFDTNTSVPGLGTVQDEDVVRWDGTRWSVWFDGTAAGLTSDALDVDAIALRDGLLWFSTVGATKVPGVAGTPDDADLYRWDGTAFCRVWDASVAGLPTAADVDGLDVGTTGRLWLSFLDAGTTVPGLGTVPDEDVVLLDGSTWSTWFDGSVRGFTTDAADVDAIDVG